MCGILGHVAWQSGAQLAPERLTELNDLMTHRGPSSDGQFVEGPVGLAMRRLAIIDLTSGDQPMTSGDGRYVIVYNGEIYNYREIREELAAEGHRFQTTSDTEVLLTAYQAWGPACLGKCNGMFAVAIWDRREQSLFLARDRLGVKPLYLANDGRRLLFASELRPIQKSGLFELEIDLRAVADLLAYWYVCEPKTIFRGITQLPPGHYALIKDGRIDLTRWWDMPAGPARRVGFGEACEELDALLLDSVRLRLRSDVPVGTLLSGGIDSGLVTAYTKQATDQPVTCFSIGFKERSYSELPLAEQTAERLSVELVSDMMGEISAPQIDGILGAMDEPLGNASLVPSYLLFRLASQRVRVVLTGDGGDELFGGYPTYQAPFFRRLWNLPPKPVRRLLRSAIHALPVSHSRISLDYRLKRFVDGVDLPFDRGHASWREVLNVEGQKRLYNRGSLDSLDGYDPFESYAAAFAGSGAMPEITRLMQADAQSYLLNDHLRKVDRTSMLNSVEAREPLLDYRLVEFAMALPPEHKVTLRRTKRILKALARPRLPRDVVEGKKKGLTPPIPLWVSRDLTGYVRENLEGGLLGRLFEPAALAGVLDEHLAKRRDNSRLIWALVSLQAWARGSGYAA
ncbi:asparagine synthase (glutamine-hydrolysing) [Tistlia consotensis]|uniref:asparagine synthase (glutamine-hydrolyzing) n=1 Tax=Tistlia consotensis USBA 355 TaxID=560819 RepID=A0A1Y6BDF0_9PROT|nr:asparagine synthase (glutamine-hydrolyzing) [Tistlia consotensis]SME98866.1 asparagine synthase (glutamine-hydrolysing) [Tistlia consotensis USBA 355]SNR58305.1 asparagine synthase (glutamine-hydrolysing) [Tistlia consotensis]